MNRDHYEFAKKAARTAYQQALLDAEVGEGGLVNHSHDYNGNIIDGQDFTPHNHFGVYAPYDHEHQHEHEHEHEELQEQVDHNEDRINALEHELEALADTKEAGEWELVSLADFDVRGQGQMLLTTDDFTASTNTLSLHSTDTEGVSHSFSRVEVGDYVEIVEEHLTRGVGDYGLYTVKSNNGNDFELVLERGMGTATYKSHFIVKFFHLNDNLDLADLDARYAQKSHSHNYASSSHSHNYASSSHTHSYAGTNHTHSGYASSSHSHSGLDATIKTGTSNNPTLATGQMYLNTNYGVVWVGR